MQVVFSIIDFLTWTMSMYHFFQGLVHAHTLRARVISPSTLSFLFLGDAPREPHGSRHYGAEGNEVEEWSMP